MDNPSLRLSEVFKWFRLNCRKALELFNFLFGEVYRRIYGQKACLWLHFCAILNLNFLPFFERYTSQKDNFECCYPPNYNFWCMFFPSTASSSFGAHGLLVEGWTGNQRILTFLESLRFLHEVETYLLLVLV